MEAEEIPKQILNVIDSFNVESDGISWIWIVLCLLTNELYFYLSFVITFDLLHHIPFEGIPRMFIFFYEFRSFV
jgi:hypothetical protein